MSYPDDDPRPVETPRLQKNSSDGAEAGPGNYWDYCPNCGARLYNHGCKYRCPDCHYFMSCSDFD